jgi:hypothetical protein
MGRVQPPTFRCEEENDNQMTPHGRNECNRHISPGCEQFRSLDDKSAQLAAPCTGRLRSREADVNHVAAVDRRMSCLRRPGGGRVARWRSTVLPAHPLHRLLRWVGWILESLLRQQTGPPAMEAVGKPVVTNGVQPRDVIVDVMDKQRD